MTPETYTAPDVLVIGAGNAAANAALAAREAGATVVMVEAAPQEARAGNSAFTGGAFRFVYDGIDDLLPLSPDIADLDLGNIDFGSYTREQYFDDMGRLTEFRSDPELTDILISNSYGAALWLKAHGVKFQPALGRQAFKVDGKFKFWGGLACHIWGGGQQLTKTLHEAVEAAGIPVLYETQAMALLQDDTPSAACGRAGTGGMWICAPGQSCWRAAGSSPIRKCAPAIWGRTGTWRRCGGPGSTRGGAIGWRWTSAPRPLATGRAHMRCSGT